MRKIRKGDQVIVRVGKDRSRVGKVLKVLVDKRCALVEDINLIKKHLKPNPQKNITGGIVTREAPISLANLALYNLRTKKADRVVIKTLADGKRIRCFKSDGEQIDI